MAQKSSGSYGQSIQHIGLDHYRLHWVIDRHYASSRLRFPTSHSRDTDERGAQRFAKKWDCNMPFPGTPEQKVNKTEK